jgi:hypothetical protein
MRSGLVAGILVTVMWSRSGAQETYPNLVVSGRLQTQAYGFDNDNQPNSTSNFFIRRARIQVNARLRENISLVIQPSFEGGRSTGVRLRDAYIDVRLTPASSGTALTLRTGAEKKPYNRYELLSSNNLPSLERNAGRGLRPVQSNNLFELGGYLATDLGASVLFDQSLDDRRHLIVQLGIYNGQGESVNDGNGAKSIGVRGTIDVTKKLGLGASFFSHEGIMTAGTGPPDSSFRNQAIGLEAQWARPGDAGFFAVADYSSGEAFNSGRDRMRGLGVVAAYHVRMRQGAWLYGVEPAVRFDWGDPDADVADNGSTMITAGVNLYLTGRAQLRLMFETQNPEAPALKTITGFRAAMTMNFESQRLHP